MKEADFTGSLVAYDLFIAAKKQFINTVRHELEKAGISKDNVKTVDDAVLCIADLLLARKR